MFHSGKLVLILREVGVPNGRETRLGIVVTLSRPLPPETRRDERWGSHLGDIRFSQPDRSFRNRPSSFFCLPRTNVSWVDWVTQGKFTLLCLCPQSRSSHQLSYLSVVNVPVGRRFQDFKVIKTLFRCEENFKKRNTYNTTLNPWYTYLVFHNTY